MKVNYIQTDPLWPLTVVLAKSLQNSHGYVDFLEHLHVT